MNVVYSTSDLYSSLTGISLVSLLENNRDINIINILILDNGISITNKKKLIAVAQKYHRQIEFYSLPEKLLIDSINIQKWNISTFGRLFEAYSLPDSIDKVIHIDCDTVIIGSLKPLIEIDMENAVVAGAVDCLSDAYKSNIGLKPEDTYINAGCIVLNLNRIRALRLEDAFLDYIEKNGRFLTYVDQEVLNACIPEKEKIAVPLKYNSYSILHYLTYRQLKILRKVNHMFSKDQFDEALNNPVVIHYTACFLEGTRPWIVGDCHPQKDSFMHYKELSPWYNMPLWEDKRSFKEKLISKLVRIIPKTIMAPAVGYVHGVYVPRKNKMQQEELDKWECNY